MAMNRTEEEKIIHREHQRLIRLAYPERVKAIGRRSYQKNRLKYLPAARIRAKRRYEENPGRSLLISQRWAKKHPEKRAESRRKWSLKNPDHSRRYIRNKRRNNPDFRLLESLRNRVWAGLKQRGYKSARTMQLVGCSIENLWLHLESQFEPGMTRENYGPVWHVDHIMPCAIFDFSKPDHQRRCFHFSNLQPLFAKDNQRKGKRIVRDFQMGFIGVGYGG